MQAAGHGEAGVMSVLSDKVEDRFTVGDLSLHLIFECGKYCMWYDLLIFEVQRDISSFPVIEVRRGLLWQLAARELALWSSCIRSRCDCPAHSASGLGRQPGSSDL